MQTYFCKLVAPRPSFSQDMTAVELKLMQDHVSYWRSWMERGKVVVFGPVADPAGPFGMGIVEVDDESEVVDLTHNDPTILADCGFRYEVLPMPRGVVRSAMKSA